MKHFINLDTWNRKEHFHFFNSMNDPYTGFIANVDCTLAYQRAKELNSSFYLYYLYQSLIAANQIESFRYRIEDNKVVCYDKIHVAATTNNNEGTFSFTFLQLEESFGLFEEEAKIKIELSKVKGGLGFDDDQKRLDCIHYTTIPWISFVGIKHAGNIGTKGSCPKISFGRYFKENNKLMLPVSVEVNHALMDGKQIGEYYQLFQELLNPL